jgi:FKBP-type peptidyl-prolyl cis-trans isomerase
MKQTYLKVLRLVLGAVLLAGGIIVYLRSMPQSVASVSANGKPIVLSAPETSDSSSVPIPATSSNPNPQSTNQPSNSLNVIDSTSAGNSNKNESANIPTPDTFSQYEQYKDKTEALFGELRMGEGAAVVMNKQVTVDYKGWLTNGKEFDESYARGKPFTFTVGAHNVILGWEEAIMGMKVGGKRRFIVPPSAGYGAAGQGSSVPPNSLLVFDVELLAVQ